MQRVDKHIYWSTDRSIEVDLDDPDQKKWWIKQVLSNGTMADVRELDLQDIAACIDQIHLPKPIRALWKYYFDTRDPGPVTP